MNRHSRIRRTFPLLILLLLISIGLSSCSGETADSSLPTPTGTPSATAATTTSLAPTPIPTPTQPPAPVPTEPPALPDTLTIKVYHTRITSFGSRRVGTPGNRQTREWLIGKLTQLGYDVETETFASTYPDTQGVNILVRIAGKDPDRHLVAGAHYDSYGDYEGSEDNATGTTALLETARRLAGSQPAVNVTLVFFDSEEYGHSGSEHFASRYADTTTLMVNMDSIGYGDYLYALSTADETGRIREYAIERAEELGASLTTHRGNDRFPPGTTGPWSDHAPFERRGVPFLYLEASNFDVPGKYGWGFTAEDPYVLHTEEDRSDYLLPRYQDRMLSNMRDASTVLLDLLLHDDWKNLLS